MSLEDAVSGTIAAPRWRYRLAHVALALAAALACGYFAVRSTVRQTATTTIRLAEQHLRQGELSQARNALGLLLWFEPDNADALVVVGDCFATAGKFAPALAAFERVPTDSLRHRTADLKRALALLHAGRVTEAEAALYAHLERYPAAPTARHELRWLLYNQLRRRDLERLLERWLADEPAQPEVLLALLDSEFRTPQPRESMKYLAEVDRLAPGQPNVLRALAVCDWEIGDLTNAHRQFAAALAADPTDFETQLRFAEFLLEQDRRAEANAVLARITSPVCREDDRYWSLMSRSAELAGATETAAGQLDEALALRPNEREYLHRKGLLRARLGKKEEASTYLDRAKQLLDCESQLRAIVWSGQLQSLTPKLCRQVADLCEARGQTVRAAGWRKLADLSVANGGRK